MLSMFFPQRHDQHWYAFPVTNWSDNSREFSHLLLRRYGVRSEHVVVYTLVPEPQREGALHKHGPAGVVLGQQLHLAGALDTWDTGRKGNKDSENTSELYMDLIPPLYSFNICMLLRIQFPEACTTKLVQHNLDMLELAGWPKLTCALARSCTTTLVIKWIAQASRVLSS